MLCLKEFNLEGREFNHLANTGRFCTLRLTQRDFNEGECQTELSFPLLGFIFLRTTVKSQDQLRDAMNKPRGLGGQALELALELKRMEMKSMFKTRFYQSMSKNM